MAYALITDNTATQVATGYTRKVIVTVNAALTGSIKVIDNTTGTTANVATITNPAVGDRYEYWDLKVGVLIIASTTCNITVSTDSSYGPH
jgi:hypothetical protein